MAAMMLMSDVRCPDRQAVFRLLAGLDGKYPNGLGWLDRRLGDIEAGRARLYQIMIGSELVAAGIETRKGPRQRKLSTFMVASSARRVGLGRALLAEMKRQWCANAIDEVIVTVDELDHATTTFFLRSGFTRVRGAKARYGPDRADLILRWRAEGESRPARSPAVS
jgi:ribosomal protein S18 acetylase RimI-like enzyme